MTPVMMARNPKNLGAIAYKDPTIVTLMRAMTAAPIRGPISCILDSEILIRIPLSTSRSEELPPPVMASQKAMTKRLHH